MRIAVDAFGSDNCPGPDVEGAVLAAKEWGDEILLVGPEERIKEELAQYDIEGLNISVVHASDVLTMQDHSRDVRNKPNSSIRIAMKLVKEGKAEAFVSAGNTIACLSSAIFDLRRIRGIRRPALCVVHPMAFEPVVLLDTGATADPKPEVLQQFADMGVIYAERVLGIPSPRVGLLANGEEEEKGTMVLRDTFALMKQQDGINFVGNIEPKELVKGEADVVITDGFTGNIHIKTAEAVASFIKGMVKRDLLGKSLTIIGAILLIPALIVGIPGLLFLVPGIKKMMKRLDYSEVGGALLLGVNGVVIVGHGRSNANAIKNAILRAREAVEADIIPTIISGLEKSQRVPSKNGE